MQIIVGIIFHENGILSKLFIKAFHDNDIFNIINAKYDTSLRIRLVYRKYIYTIHII